MRINGFGPAQSVVPSRLTHVAAGWTDQELVTVRKMAAAGATAEDIGAACGKNKQWAHNYIRRNKLVWNRVRGDVSRHVIASAGAISAHMTMGHGAWVEEGAHLRAQGISDRQIAEQLGVSLGTVSSYFQRHNIPRPPGFKREKAADRSKMLALVIRLHVEGVLTEGQVQAATGLNRVRIRTLVGKVTA